MCDLLLNMSVPGVGRMCLLRIQIRNAIRIVLEIYDASRPTCLQIRVWNVTQALSELYVYDLRVE